MATTNKPEVAPATPSARDDRSVQLTHVASNNSIAVADPKSDELQAEIAAAEKGDGYGNLSLQEATFLRSFDEARKKKLYRKVDFRLVPMLALLYLFSYIDRSNIGNARIEGLDDDLGITDTQWNIVLMIFFVPYILFEVPCNAILHRYFKERPSWWIGFLTISWGIVMTLHGVVQNYGGLVAARFFLGVPEAGFFPGAILICSYWYPRQMIQTRIALFYTSSATAGAFSGLLAFAIARMDGIGGLEGWRYIFLLEGAATVALGLTVPFLLVDSPAKSKWLTEDEKRYLTLAVQAQDGGSRQQAKAHGIDWASLKQVLTDWHLYLFCIIYWAGTIPNYALTFTMPLMMTQAGYSSSDAQLLTIPQFFVGAVSAYVSARYADKYRRYPFLVGPLLIVIVGFAITIPYGPTVASNFAPVYVGLLFANIGIYCISPGILAWSTGNLAGPAKRAMGISFLICVGNIGGIIGSFIFFDREAPRYPTGYGTSLAMAGAGICAATALEFTFIHKNRKNERQTEDQIRAKYTEDELADMGDRSPLYRYVT